MKISFIILTGNDSGIYDAFNACTTAAHGKYILFFGCGDTLADDFVIGDIKNYLTEKFYPDIVYGVVFISDFSGNITTTFDNSCYFGSRLIFPWRNPCHSQGLIYKRTWLIKRLFSTTAGPLSDLVHTIEHKIHKNSIFFARPITFFLMGGISNKNTKSALKARLSSVIFNCNNFSKPIFWRTISRIVFYIRIKQL